MLNMSKLETCFYSASEQDCLYIGVLIEMEGFEKPEIIINESPNFNKKLDYYKKAYNDDLTLKAFNGIKIIGFAYANNFEEIQKELLG